MLTVGLEMSYSVKIEGAVVQINEKDIWTKAGVAKSIIRHDGPPAHGPGGNQGGAPRERPKGRPASRIIAGLRLPTLVFDPKHISYSDWE